MNDDETLENKTTNHETEAVKRKKAESHDRSWTTSGGRQCS